MAKKEWLKIENARIHKNTIEFIMKEAAERREKKKWQKASVQNVEE